MCDISKAINCGLFLDLKDFSDQFLDDEFMSKKVPVKSSYVQVLLNNNYSMVIKKSSFLLLEQHRARVSSDRLLRFINSRCDQDAEQINKIKCNQTKQSTQSDIEVNEESDIQSESIPPISPYQSYDSNEDDKDTQI